MYCKKCGNLLSDEDDFCGVCGTKVSHADTKDNSVALEDSERIAKTEEKQDSVKPETVEDKQIQQNSALQYPQYVMLDKWFKKKIGLVILAIIIFALSKAKLIVIFVPMSIDDIAKGAEVLRYLNKDIVEGFQIFYWVFKIGAWSYLAAALFMLLDKENIADFFFSIGVLCNICIVILVGGSAYENPDILKMFTEAGWAYVIMNVVLVVSIMVPARNENLSGRKRKQLH